MTPTLHDTVTKASAARRSSEVLAPALFGGLAIYAATLVLELFEPDMAVFVSWVFGLPLVVGAVLGARGRRPALAAGANIVAYLLILVHDWIAAGNDRVFHLVLAVLTGGLAALAAAAARGLRRHFVGQAAQVVPAKS